MDGPDDAHHALLRRLLTDEGGAWTELIEAYSPLLLAVARRTFAAYGVRPTQQDPEDAVAEVWKNLLENDRRLVRTCLERSNLLQTLQVLARHRAIDIMRRRHPAAPLSETQGLAADEPERIIDVYPLEEVARAARALTPRERVLVNLFFLQGKKYREIAELTGIPINSIGPTLARALARLRSELGE